MIWDHTTGCRGHNELQIEILKHHVRIGITDCDAENLGIVGFEMVLRAIPPPQVQTGHDLGLFDRLTALAAIAGCLLELLRLARLANKVVGDILKFLAELGVAYLSPPAPLPNACASARAAEGVRSGLGLSYRPWFFSLKHNAEAKGTALVM